LLGVDWRSAVGGRRWPVGGRRSPVAGRRITVSPDARGYNNSSLASSTVPLTRRRTTECHGEFIRLAFDADAQAHGCAGYTKLNAMGSRRVRQSPSQLAVRRNAGVLSVIARDAQHLGPVIGHRQFEILFMFRYPARTHDRASDQHRCQRANAYKPDPK
jgi:hypothetical protein